VLGGANKFEDAGDAGVEQVSLCAYTEQTGSLLQLINTHKHTKSAGEKRVGQGQKSWTGECVQREHGRS